MTFLQKRRGPPRRLHWPFWLKANDVKIRKLKNRKQTPPFGVRRRRDVTCVLQGEARAQGGNWRGTISREVKGWTGEHLAHRVSEDGQMPEE